MERLKLSKTEKRIIRLLNAGFVDIPTDIPYDKYATAANSLKNKGLVRCTILTNGAIWDISLTKSGKFYLHENPQLYNPVDWNKIGAIGGFIAALAAIASLLVGCSIFMRL